MIQAVARMAAGLLARASRTRLKRARAAYKKLVYDRRFQLQKYHSKKREHRRNEVRHHMRRSFPDFVHVETLWTAHADRGQRREIEYFKEIGATLLCVEFDEPHAHGAEACCNDIVDAWRGRTVFVRVSTAGLGAEAWLADLRGELEALSARIEDGLNATFLEVWYLHYGAGAAAAYDEHTAPGWLDTWLACQDAWRREHEGAGAAGLAGAGAGRVDRRCLERIRADMDAYHWGWVRERLGCAECQGWYVGWQFGSARYDGHCLRCFREKFPEDERVKQRARTEKYMKAFVEVFFPEFVQAQAVETAHRESAHRRTITHYAVVRGTMICVDTDEQAYRRHDPADEVARYNEIVRFWRGRTVFVRLDLDAEGCALGRQVERLRGALGGTAGLGGRRRAALPAPFIPPQVWCCRRCATPARRASAPTGCLCRTRCTSALPSW